MGRIGRAASRAAVVILLATTQVVGLAAASRADPGRRVLLALAQTLKRPAIASEETLRLLDHDLADVASSSRQAADVHRPPSVRVVRTGYAVFLLRCRYAPGEAVAPPAVPHPGFSLRPVTTRDKALLALLRSFSPGELRTVCSPTGVRGADVTAAQLAALRAVLATLTLQGLPKGSKPPAERGVGRFAIFLGVRARFDFPWRRYPLSVSVWFKPETKAPPALPAPTIHLSSAAAQEPALHTSTLAELATEMMRRTGKGFCVLPQYAARKVVLTAPISDLNTDVLRLALTVPLGLGLTGSDRLAIVAPVPGSAEWLLTWGGEERLMYYQQLFDLASQVCPAEMQTAALFRLGGLRTMSAIPTPVRKKLLDALRRMATMPGGEDVRLLKWIEGLKPSSDVGVAVDFEVELRVAYPRLGVVPPPGSGPSSVPLLPLPPSGELGFLDNLRVDFVPTVATAGSYEPIAGAPYLRAEWPLLY